MVLAACACILLFTAHTQYIQPKSITGINGPVEFTANPGVEQGEAILDESPENISDKENEEVPRDAKNVEDEWYINSNSFESNRGNLPWPVTAGTVITHFGPYKLSTLKCMSDGIAISLPVGSAVSTVADGVVTAIFDLDGTKAVIVKHGKYFTTYSNLDSVVINKGDTIKVSTTIGTVAADESGEGQLLFMVSNEKGSFLDPEKWLKRDYIQVALK